MKLSIIAAIAPFVIMTAAAPTDDPLGINCRGNSNCAGNIGNLSQLHSAVLALNPNNYYTVGQHIACVRNICAFYQNNSGGTAGDAATHINNLLNHGCNKCGSDPTTPGNNVNNGELTCNWVAEPN